MLHAYTQRGDGHPDLSMTKQQLEAICWLVNSARSGDLITRAEADAMVAAAWEAAAVIADDAAYDNDAEASRFRSGSNSHWAKVCEAKLHRAVAAAIRAVQPAPAKEGE